MSIPISEIEWIEKSSVVDELRQQEEHITIHPMTQGLEAEVIKLHVDEEEFVLKVWNKHSKPDVHFQYQLLKALVERGTAVSKPLGWGINTAGDRVLLTSFDGLPTFNVTTNKMKKLANILSTIHHIPLKELQHIQLPTYDFVKYFFPYLNEYPDVSQEVTSLMQQVQLKQEALIHGDFHLGNIVESKERYTVIDWTNAQLGDARYDVAWSCFLKKIYISEQYAEVFCAAYVEKQAIREMDQEVFEALACLRWMLLDRSNGLPKGPTTMRNVTRLIRTNVFLHRFQFEDIALEKME